MTDTYTGGDLWPDDAHVEERVRLDRDLLIASRTMGDDEARYLVDAYYIMQEDRKRTGNQVRSLGDEPHVVIQWLFEKNSTLEKQIAKALDQYTGAHMMGSWMRDIFGIGPVLSAGLLAHIYMGEWCFTCHAHSEAICASRQSNGKHKSPPHVYQPVRSCPTVGHIWQYGGIAGDGQHPWEKGQKRPFNAGFKTLLWKCGQSFMKFSNHPQCFYGHIYRQRKAYEVAGNEAGRFADQAAKALPRYSPTTEAHGHYSKGRLPPAHIDARARRYAVKIFLSHLHAEWYRRQFGEEPPVPFPIAHLGHAHYIPPPV